MVEGGVPRTGCTVVPEKSALRPTSWVGWREGRADVGRTDVTIFCVDATCFNFCCGSDVPGEAAPG